MIQKTNLQFARLQDQNRRLQKAIDQCMEEIQHLKHVNNQHEKEIQSLLKFNERLLTIIEEQVNNNQSRFNEKSLQPISQVTENDSQTMDQLMQSLQKTRNKLAARSQKGVAYMSQIQNKHTNYADNNKVYQYMHEMKDLERSERYVSNDRDPSEFGNKSSFSKKREKKASAGNKIDYGSVKNQDFDQQVSIDILPRSSTQTKPFFVNHVFNGHVSDSDSEKKKASQQQYKKIEETITEKINRQKEEMRKCSQKNHDFLEQKIDQLNKLSKEMTFNPEQKFNEIQSKIKLSPQIAALLKKAMVKR